MTVRRLDENGDIVTRGQQFISEKEEIAQTVKTRLALFLGEYFRNITDGTPWFQQVLGKFASLDTAEAVIRARIVNTEGVIQLVSFSTNYDLATRKLNVTAGILTKFGVDEVSFSG